MAVPDLVASYAMTCGTGIRLVQSPCVSQHPNLPVGGEAINFAGFLQRHGWAQKEQLSALVEGWRSLIDLVRPDAMVYDHAPAALLAAHIVGVPVMLLGNGFEIPPTQSPLPAFRPWEMASAQQLIDAEKLVVQVVNEILAKGHIAPINKLHDLYKNHPTVMPTFPELDHFEPRTDAQYCGPIATAPMRTSQVSWKSTRKKVLVYVRANLPHVQNLLLALREVDAENLCVMPDLPASWVEQFPWIRFYSSFIELDSLLASTDVVITSGSGTIVNALQHGIPVVVMPHVIEQYLAGAALERMGAGKVLRGRETAASCLQPVHDVLQQPRFNQAAQAFAQKYADWTAETALEIQWKSLHSLL